MHVAADQYYLVLRLGDIGHIELQSHLGQETYCTIAVPNRVGALLRSSWWSWCWSCCCCCCCCCCSRGGYSCQGLVCHTYAFCDKRQRKQMNKIKNKTPHPGTKIYVEVYLLDSAHFLACTPPASCQRK